jgi:hypothetical protein
MIINLFRIIKATRNLKIFLMQTKTLLFFLNLSFIHAARGNNTTLRMSLNSQTQEKKKI